ncbi:unnamed protein product [Blepharisma stoltei]|uniref:von Willebrand factor A domain-containing protein 5A n=1 Tax=Blepharisma stoltei TaxID=1481888 RepID=A0AAU9IFV7_9CILI|nr:unnamed protein product [Blepharisma stoltei]
MRCGCCCFGLRPIRPIPSPVEKHPISLKHLELRSTVRNSLCKMELFQVYKNIETQPIECEYVFPVENDAVITAMRIHLPDGTILEASIEEETKAQEMYQDAISEGNTAVMTKSDTPDKMVVNVGNIAPGAEIRIEFKFTTPISTELDFWKLYIPTTLTPKAQLQPNSIPLEEIKQETQFTVVNARNCTYRIGMSIDIHSDTPISDFSCKTYPFEWTLSENCLHLSGRFREGNDFIPDAGIKILYKTANSNFPLCAVQERKGEYAAMLSFLPMYKQENEEIEDLQGQRGEFLFVIDRSGSMAGERINLAKKAAVLFLKSLPPGSVFNIVSFGGRFDWLDQGPIDYNSNNVEKAIRSVEKFEADMGGTNIYDPLNSIYSTPPNKALPRSIFLLTDGAVSNPEAVVNLIRQNSKSATVHSVGIGNEVSTFLIKESAKAGGGVPSFVSGLEELSKKVINALEKCLMPALSDWKLNWDAFPAPSPENLKRVYYGDRFILYAHLGPTIPSSMPKLQCYDSRSNTEREFIIQAGISHFTAGDEIFKLWAKNRISEIETGNLPQEVKNSQIVQLSKEYGIPSSLTSYICIQKNSEAVVGEIQLRKIPVAKVRDMSQASVPMASMNRSLKMCAKMAMPRSAAPTVLWRAPDVTYKDTFAFRYTDSRCDEQERSVPKKKKAKKAEKEEEKQIAAEADTSESEIYLSIIKQQSAEGFWSFRQLSSALNIGKEIPAEFANLNQADDIWGTLVALAYLRKNYGSNKDEWKLVERKSIKWLKSSAIPIEESIQKAIEFLN